MNRDDSITIVAFIVNSWPGPAWDADRLDAYARALEGFDAELTTRAVALAVKELKYRPSIAELRQFIHIERALSVPEKPNEQPAKPGRLPAWVKGWLVARVKYQDFRVWAEQDPSGTITDLMPGADRNRYMAEGGDVTLSTMLKTLGVSA